MCRAAAAPGSGVGLCPSAAAAVASSTRLVRTAAADRIPPASAAGPEAKRLRAYIWTYVHFPSKKRLRERPGSVRLVGGVGGRPRLLGQRGDLELALGRGFQHLGGLLRRARVELDQEVDDDLLVVVLVEADVGEELTHPGIAEGTEGEELDRLRARAGLDPVLVHPDRAGGDPGSAGDHPLPAVFDRHDAVVLEGEV